MQGEGINAADLEGELFVGGNMLVLLILGVDLGAVLERRELPLVLQLILHLLYQAENLRVLLGVAAHIFTWGSLLAV